MMADTNPSDLETRKMTNENEINLENKLKFDWHEIVPLVGWAKWIINLDYAKKRNYVGLGGQFAKHIEQRERLGFTNSIPTNTIIYALYQAPASVITFGYLKSLIQ